MTKLSVDHKTVTRFCKGCVSGTINFPDVFFDGKPEENLADDPRTGQPPVFFSKSHKAEYLRSKGLQEAGDRVHGSYATFAQNQNQNQKTDTKHEVKMVLKQIKEMGHDRRREEYNRIKKEGERHVK